MSKPASDTASPQQSQKPIIEAVEDYRLKEATGVSVIDRAPDEAAFPVTKFLQYLSPRESRTQKRE